MTAPQVVVFSTPLRFDLDSLELLIMRTLLGKVGADDAFELTCFPQREFLAWGALGRWYRGGERLVPSFSQIVSLRHSLPIPVLPGGQESARMLFWVRKLNN